MELTGSVGVIVVEVALLAVVGHLVEQAQCRCPERALVGGGGEEPVQRWPVGDHHVLEPVDAGREAVCCLLGGGDVGEDAPAKGVRFGDQRVQGGAPETRHVTGDGAVDDLDEVHVVVFDQAAQHAAALGGIADLDGDVGEPGHFAVQDRPDGMAPGRGEDAARRDDTRCQQHAVALGRSSRQDDVLVVTDADHRRDTAAQVGAPVPPLLLRRELLGPDEPSGTEHLVGVGVPEAGHKPPSPSLDDRGAPTTRGLGTD